MSTSPIKSFTFTSFSDSGITFCDLPAEVIIEIFTHCDFPTLKNLALTNKKIGELIKIDYFWREFAKRIDPYLISPGDTKDKILETFKEIYVLTKQDSGDKNFCELTVEDIRRRKVQAEEIKKRDAIKLLRHIIFSDAFDEIKEIEGLREDITSEQYWLNNFADIESKKYEDVNKIVKKWIQDHREIYQNYNECYESGGDIHSETGRELGANLESLPEAFSVFADTNDGQDPIFPNIELNNNAFRAIPLCIITAFSHIQILHLCYNQLTVLPKNLINLRSLQEIALTGNKLKKVDILTNISSLKEIWVDENKLQSLNVKGFKGLPTLQRFVINQNPDLSISQEDVEEWLSEEEEAESEFEFIFDERQIVRREPLENEKMKRGTKRKRT